MNRGGLAAGWVQALLFMVFMAGGQTPQEARPLGGSPRRLISGGCQRDVEEAERAHPALSAQELNNARGSGFHNLEGLVKITGVPGIWHIILSTRRVEVRVAAARLPDGILIG